LGPPSLADRPLIGLAPGSVWATKRWPYYTELACLLNGDARLAIVGGKDDAPIAAEIAAAASNRVVDATGKLSLLGSAELIRRCAILVTNDSAPQHLASAVGTPTITVFGPTVPEFGFGPLAPRSKTVGVAGLECRPCDRHGPMRCPLGHWRCMRELTASVVADAIARIQSEAP
jgi:heptosyltransferase-2